MSAIGKSQNKERFESNLTDIESNEIKKGDQVEVLYQKLGDRWYAFSLIGDEVYMGSLSEEEAAKELPPHVRIGEK